MTDRELMQQALEALEEINKLSVGENAICLPAEIDTAMDALRERLAQPEPKHHQYPLQSDRMRIDPVTGDVGIGTPIAKPVQQEPVAWRYLTQYESGASIWTYCAGEPANRETRQPLYTSPPVQRTWVGLTEKDFSAINQSCLTKLQAVISAESILKEKNA